jgi:outer membrane protein TolC
VQKRRRTVRGLCAAGALVVGCMGAATAAAGAPEPFELADNEPDLTAMDEASEVMEPVKPLPLSLHDAVALALRHNFSIRLAGLQRLTDRFTLFVAQDRFAPHASLVASAGPTYAFGPQTLQSPAGTQVTVTPHAEWLLPLGTTVAADLLETTSLPAVAGTPPFSSALVLSVTQPLIKNFGVNNNLATVQRAIWQAGMDKLALKATVLEVVRQVILSYRDFARAAVLRDIGRKAVERARQVLDNNEQLAAAGRIARADLVQVQSDIATREANLASAETDLVGFQVALAQLLALSPDAPIAPMRESGMLRISYSLQQARSVALANRPEYVSSVMAQQRAAADLVVARNNRLWDLSLVAQVKRGYAANALAPAFLAPAMGPSQSIFVGATLTVPLIESLLDQQVVQGEVALAQAAVNRVAASNQVRLAVDGAMRTLRLQQRVYRLSIRARSLAAKNLENEQEKLSAGRSSTFIVLRFVDDLVNAEIAEILAQVAFLNAATAVQEKTGTLLDGYAAPLD